MRMELFKYCLVHYQKDFAKNLKKVQWASCRSILEIRKHFLVKISFVMSKSSSQHSLRKNTVIWRKCNFKLKYFILFLDLWILCMLELKDHKKQNVSCFNEIYLAENFIQFTDCFENIVSHQETNLKPDAVPLYA